MQSCAASDECQHCNSQPLARLQMYEQLEAMLERCPLVPSETAIAFLTVSQRHAVCVWVDMCACVCVCAGGVGVRGSKEAAGTHD